MKPTTYFAALIAGCMLSLDAICGGAIIVNSAVDAEQLNKNVVKRLFLRKTSKLPNGHRTQVVDQQEGSPVRDEFYKTVVKKTPSQLKAYWSKQIFSGKGSPPQQLPNDSAVKSWVIGNQDAMGYISEDAVDDSVKVLFRYP